MKPATLGEKPPTRRLWQETLQPLKLPANPAVKTRAIQKLLSRTGNADNVARIIMEDPVLVLRVVCSANKLLARSGNELKSLSHGISLLGVPSTESLLRSAPEYDRQGFAALDAFLQQLCISQHAAVQAAGWSRHHPHWLSEEVYLAALLQRAPIWTLWHQAADAMQALAATPSGGAHEQLEKMYLGCSMQSLAASLCRAWHLPSATQASWFPGERGGGRQWVMLSRIIPEQAALALETFPALQRISREAGLCIALANRLAEESQRDWYSRRTLRLQHILAVALCQPLPPVVTLTHQLAADASRQLDVGWGLSPAAQLLGFYRAHPTHQAAQDTTTDEPTRAAAAQRTTTTPDYSDPLAGAPQPLLQLIADLRRRPQLFNDLHELFNRVVQCLHQVVGFERASASLLNAKTQELRTYYSAGCDDSPELKAFRYTLSDKDLFSKLLSRPLSLRLQPDNYPQLWPLLPGAFKQACGADQFVVMSLFVNRRPLALVYADRGISNSDINEQEYEWFKQLCNAVSICLTQRTRQKQ